ncbi:MAG: cupredoxin domain-containing protein [Acidimicrobiales bacterium]
MRVPRYGAVAMALVLTLGAGACSSSKKASSTTSSASSCTSSSATVDISNYSYKPSPCQVKVGEKITVTNVDNTDHSLTANDGAFDTGVFSSGSKTITITKAGTYSIHCRIHSFMQGTIVVS